MSHECTNCLRQSIHPEVKWSQQSSLWNIVADGCFCAYVIVNSLCCCDIFNGCHLWCWECRMLEPKDFRCHVGQILPFKCKEFLTPENETQCHQAWQFHCWNRGCLQIWFCFWDAQDKNYVLGVRHIGCRGPRAWFLHGLCLFCFSAWPGFTAFSSTLPVSSLFTVNAVVHSSVIW